jgi:ABC-type transporter Mla subunit MlaD
VRSSGTSALASIDAQVGQFNDNMAAVTDLLAAERGDLKNAISLLDQALGDVAGFVQDNRALLTTNIDRLADITLTLVQQREAMAEVLDVAPAALSNLARAYNPDYGTLDTRDNGLGSLNAEVVVCGALAQLGRVDVTRDLPIPNPLDPQPLPTTTEAICARLLSGDANADNQLDDLNGNGVPDLQELLTAIFGSGGGAGGGSQLPGLPVVGGGSR